MKRKCTYRFMFIASNGEVRIISQDIRRSRNIITGNVLVYRADGKPFNSFNAKALGCDFIVREK